jgi:peptidoglycan hydrolase-like protein with peptidoglycan-binding domain
MTRDNTTRIQQQPSTSHPLSSGILQRKCISCGQHAIAGEQCEDCLQKRKITQTTAAHDSQLTQADLQSLQAPSVLTDLTQIPIQAKLRVGQPNDQYEQEADRVAEQVMRMPEPGLQRQSELPEEDEDTLQTKPLASQITPLTQLQTVGEAAAQRAQSHDSIQRQVEPPEEDEEKPIQAKRTENTGTLSPQLENTIQSAKGGGQPLSSTSRVFFEPRFGADFSQVRVHPNFDQARDLNAQAFTTGKDIFFGQGMYQPQTDTGERLLAHELTHVMQQGHASTSLQRQVQTPTSILPRLISESLGQNSELQLIAMGKSPPLRRGDKGKAVEDVQLALMKLDGNALPKYGADGDFGGETEAAIVDFQTANGLLIERISEHTSESAEKGAVDSITLQEMDSQCNYLEQMFESDEDIELKDEDIEYAMKQNIIYNRLLGFAERDDWPEAIGSPTYVWRVAKYQKENGLEIDGIMGEGTWTVRGAELGIDVQAERNNWLSGRVGGKDIELRENVTKQDYMTIGMESVDAVLEEKGAHTARKKQMRKKAKTELERAWNNRGTELTKACILEIWLWIQSGESAIVVNILDSEQSPASKPIKLTVPVPWTWNDLKTIKEKKLADPELVERAKQVLIHWDIKYGKWFKNNGHLDRFYIANNYWVEWFFNMSNIPDTPVISRLEKIKFSYSPLKLLRKFGGERARQVKLLNLPMPMNPYWPEDNARRYNFYKFELEGRDPVSVDFNFNYRQYIDAENPRKLVEPPKDAQKFLISEPTTKPLNNKQLKAEIKRLEKLLMNSSK